MPEEAKHTPGPWQWVLRDSGPYLVHPHLGFLTVMDFVRRGMQGGTFRLATWDGPDRGNMGGIMRPAHEIDLTSHPDARLIAAAPDLLAALLDLAYAADTAAALLKETCPAEAESVELRIEAAKAAIAKAKGGAA